MSKIASGIRRLGRMRRRVVEAARRDSYRVWIFFLYVVRRRAFDPVFVLGTPRTGSNLFLSYLYDPEDGTRFAFEILNPSYVPFGLEPGKSKRAVLRHVRHSLNACGTRKCGAKIFFEHLQLHGITVKDLEEAFPSAKFVVLYRGSGVEQYVSNELAKKTKLWWATDASKVPPVKVRVDRALLRSWFWHNRNLYREYFYDSRASSRRLLLKYEALAEHPAEIFENTVFPFLGLPPRTISTNRVKLGWRPLEERVENCSELAVDVASGQYELLEDSMVERTRRMPRISVVICTRNRCAQFRLAMNSLLSQDLPPEDYEIIVVDNASIDDTPSVLPDSPEQGPTVRYLYECRPGLSGARNAGWNAARAPYVAFLDDDAIASAGWLKKILEAFERFPMAGCIGGKVELFWSGSRPEWLHDKLCPHLSQLDWAPHPVILRADQWIVGTNMVFPRELLARAGGFSTLLGRKGSKLLSGEEIALQKFVRHQGRPCVYDPAVFVKHYVPVERLSSRWFLRRSFWQGVTASVEDSLEWRRFHPRRIRLFLRHLYKLLCDVWYCPRFFFDPVKGVLWRCQVLTRIGYVANFLGMAR